MSQDPNSFNQEIAAAQGANPQAPDQGTGGGGAPSNPPADPTQPVDYATKFAESSKEALRLLKETEDLKAENDRLKALGTTPAPSGAAPVENLYPGFEQLEPEAQANLVAYTNLVTKRVTDSVYQDPSIKFAREQYNTNKWESAFQVVAAQHPELVSSKEEFKKKYFNPNNVPDNIGSLLSDIAKIHLFDKAKEIGAKEELDRQGRVPLERPTSGGTPPSGSSRTLDDWNRMAQENPVEFAKHSKEFNEAMATGKIPA